MQEAKQETDYESKYMLSGETTMATVGAVIALIVGVSIATLVMTFTGSLSGQTYNLVEPDLNTLTSSHSDYLFTAVNSTAVTVYDDIVSGTLSVTNRTGTSIALTNFNIDYDLGTLYLKNNSLNNKVLNATFQAGDPVAQGHIQRAIISGFEAQEQTGNYLPLIVLAVVIFMLLGLVLGMQVLGNSGYRGSAL